MTDTTQLKGMFSIETIQKAASEIAAFKPVVLPVEGGVNVTVRKLPDDKFRELLGRFGEQIAPFLGSSDERVELDGPALMGLLKQLPGFVDDLLEHATDFNDLNGYGQLPTDVRVVCAAAVLVVSYIDNAAVRVFIDAVQLVNESVAAESEAAASDEQRNTAKS